MVFLSKIYTRGGDQGKTSLGDGVRVPKQAPRIEAIGAIDEANAFLGFASVTLDSSHQKKIIQIQHDLFDIGADLCMPHDHEKKSTLRIQLMHIKRLEEEIDAMNAHLTPLHSFILPGGSAAAAHLHLARTVVRRAERQVCSLAETENINKNILCYINRLSDHLFVFARYINDLGEKDILWQPGANL